MRFARHMLLAIILLAGAGALSALAADQVRSTDTLVYSSNTTVSAGTINAPFTVYVGDNLSGVTSPVKSLYFPVSGVYTGSGSLTLTIDSDSATSQAFTLPNVGSTPTPFEFVYKDPSGKINPSSAGSYNYILNIVSSGVTMTAFGIRMNETHRFVPASCADGSTQKVKTNEFLIVSSNTSVTTERTDSFGLYLGDSMSGVTAPSLKSLQFAVSGVYTGASGGTVIMKLNGDAATAQTFTLPSVSAPTYYEFIYKDPTGSISPTSAGSYTYTITTTPSGVTLYQFGITARDTHRYAPPSCGGTATGELTSAIFDTTGSANGPAYNSILWKGSAGTGKVRFQLATANADTGPWNFIGGATCSSGDWYSAGTQDSPVEISCAPANHNNQRYFKYKVQLCSNTDCSSVGATSPTVNDIIVNWAP